MAEVRQDWGSILARYAEGPQCLEEAIAGLSGADLDPAPDSENWSIRQIVHHVVDGDDLWKTCIKAALGNSTGTFALRWYWDVPQDQWAEAWSYDIRGIAGALARFAANRQHIVDLIEWTDSAWERTIFIQWPEGDPVPVTVAYVVEMQGRHVEAHIADITAIRQAHGL
jgi:hypothetical protein